MNKADSDWAQMEQRREKLFAEMIDQLSKKEYEVLEATLKEESENRHLIKPHGLKKRLQEMIERTVK